MKTTKYGITRLSVLLTTVFFTLNAYAQVEHTQNRSPFSLGAEGGTTGIGPVIRYTASPKLHFSLSYGVVDIEYDNVKGSKIRYDGEVEMTNLAAMVAWHPFGGRFHLATGAVFFDHQIDITARTRRFNVYEIGDHSYTDSQVSSLTGKVDANSVAPYLGVGWTWHLGKSGFSLITDFGLMYTDGYEARLTATGPITTDPVFIDDLRKEEKSITDSTTFFPVAKFGFVYRF